MLYSTGSLGSRVRASKVVRLALSRIFRAELGLLPYETTIASRPRKHHKVRDLPR